MEHCCVGIDEKEETGQGRKKKKKSREVSTGKGQESIPRPIWLKNLLLGQSNSTVYRVFAFHVSDPGSILESHMGL